MGPDTKKVEREPKLNNFSSDTFLPGFAVFVKSRKNILLVFPIINNVIFTFRMNLGESEKDCSHLKKRHRVRNSFLNHFFGAQTKKI